MLFNFYFAIFGYKIIHKSFNQKYILNLLNIFESHISKD